jgi:hypothetical protein
MPESDKRKKRVAPVATRASVRNRGPFPERVRLAGDGKGAVPSVHERPARKAKSPKSKRSK